MGQIEILNYNNDLWSNPNSDFYDMFSDSEGNWKEIWTHSHYISFYVQHQNYQGLYSTNQDDIFGYDLYDSFLFVISFIALGILWFVIRQIIRSATKTLVNVVLRIL